MVAHTATFDCLPVRLLTHTLHHLLDFGTACVHSLSCMQLFVQLTLSAREALRSEW